MHGSLSPKSTSTGTLMLLKCGCVRDGNHISVPTSVSVFLRAGTLASHAYPQRPCTVSGVHRSKWNFDVCIFRTVHLATKSSDISTQKPILLDWKGTLGAERGRSRSLGQCYHASINTVDGVLKYHAPSKAPMVEKSQW